MPCNVRQIENDQIEVHNTQIEIGIKNDELYKISDGRLKTLKDVMNNITHI